MSNDNVSLNLSFGEFREVIEKIQAEASPSLWTDYFHRDTERYATKQDQHDALVETLLSCGIPADNIKVVCDEDENIYLK